MAAISSQWSAYSPIGVVHDAGRGGLVGLVRLDAAVVDGEFLEIGEDGERQFGGPGIAAQLEGGAEIVLDIDGGFLGFEEELARAADAEAVVGGLGDAADLDGILVDDILVCLGVPARLFTSQPSASKKGSMNSRRTWVSL